MSILRRYPFVMLAVAPLFWGGNITLGRFVHETMPPIGLSFWRWIIATAILLLLVFPSIRRQWGELRGQLGLLAALSLTGCAGFHTTLYIALNGTTALNVGLMMTSIPVVIAPFAFLLLGETLTWRQALGLVGAMAGAVVIVSRGDLQGLAALQVNPGDFWMLAAIPFWSLYSVLVKKIPRTLDPLVVVAMQGLMAIPMILPFYLWETGVLGAALWDVPRAMPVTWQAGVSLAYISIGATVLGFYCFNEGVIAVGPTRAGPFLHLVPLYASMMAILLLGEQVGAHHLVGVGLIVLGIVVASWSRRPTSPPN